MSVNAQDSKIEQHTSTQNEGNNTPYGRSSSHRISALEEDIGVEFASVPTVRRDKEADKVYIEDMNGQVRYYLGEDYLVIPEDQMETEFVAHIGERDSIPYQESLDIAHDYTGFALDVNVRNRPQPLSLSDGSEVLVCHRFVPEDERHRL